MPAHKDPRLAPIPDDRALVPCRSGTSGQPSSTFGAALPDAGFLAQVLASHGQGRMYRRLRRSEPAEALARYRATDRKPAAGKTILVA